MPSTEISTNLSTGFLVMDNPAYKSVTVGSYSYLAIPLWLCLLLDWVGVPDFKALLELAKFYFN